MDIIDLTHPDGVENPSGHSSMHGIALLSDFTPTGIKKPADIADVGATPATVGAIATAHTFAAGKCMKKLYGTENKGESKEEVVGDTDSPTSKHNTVIMIPGLKPEYHANRRLLNNQIGIAFISMADGKVVQYGSERFPAHFRVTWGSGNNEGYRGYTLTITGYGDGVIYAPGLNFTPAV